jgi:hypothetical protein
MIPGGKSTKALPSRTGSSGGGPSVAAPFKKAFVVQFVERVGASSMKFEGRVEHLETGRRANFGSRKGLLQVLAGMLVQASPCLGEEGETSAGKPPSQRRGAETS